MRARGGAVLFVTGLLALTVTAVPASAAQEPRRPDPPRPTVRREAPAPARPDRPTLKPYRQRGTPQGTHLRHRGTPRPFDYGDKLIPALRAGKISKDEFVRLGILSVLRPSRLPAKWRPKRPLGSLAPMYYSAVMSQLPGTSASTRQWARKLGTLAPRPAASPNRSRTAAARTLAADPPVVEECSYPASVALYDFDCLHRTEHFAIRYSLSYEAYPGVFTPGLPEADADGNGYPDALDSLSEGLEAAWTTYTGMGYTAPTPETGQVLVLVGVDDNENPGLTLQNIGPAGGGAPVVLLPSNPDAADKAGSNYLARHELFHVFQYSYFNSLRLIGCDVIIICTTNEGPSLNWWMEATAEWAVHKSYLADPTAAAEYPEQAKAYARNIGRYLEEPTAAVNRFDGFGGAVQYGAFILPTYLALYAGGDDAVRRTWENLKGGLPMEAIDQTLWNVGVNPDDFYGAFAVARYLGSGHFYGDDDVDAVWRPFLQARSATAGDDLGPARPARTRVTLAVNEPATGSVALQPGGSAYYDLAIPQDGTSRSHMLRVRVAGSGMKAYLLTWSDEGYPSRYEVHGPLERSEVLTSEDGPTLLGTVPPGAKSATLVVLRNDRVSLSQDAVGDSDTAAWSVQYDEPVSPGVWAWGYNKLGQLANGTTANSDRDYFPRRIEGLADVAMMSGGGGNGYAVKTDGSLWAWGWNKYGQVGDGTTTDRATPVRVEGLPPVVSVSGGSFSAYALTADGGVWSWGHGDNGALGNGTTQNSSVPVKVPISDVVAVEGGDEQAFAVKSDGTVWGWGFDEDGGLGDAGSANRLTPVQIPGLSDVVQISSGNDLSTFALRRDGTVWVWGDNYYGQLGIGTQSGDPVTTPVQNPHLGDIKQVAAGDRFGYALTRGGEVWGWGDNHDLVLGTDAVRFSYVPVKVPGLDHVTTMAAGYWNGYALRSDGVLFSVGWSEQLGAGVLRSPFPVAPIPVALISGVDDIASYGDSTYAIIR